MSEPAYTLGELADHIQARLVGDANAVINGLGSLATAEAGEVSHLSSPAYRKHLAGTRATALILREADLPLWDGNALVSENPYLSFALVSQLFTRRPELAEGLHPTAEIHPGAVVEPGARLGPGVVVGARTRVAAGARLHAHVVVGEDCRIGEEVTLMPGVVIYPRVKIGARSTAHSGVVIGADGFGFAPSSDGRLEPIAQLGGVSIGEDVSIGAGTTIDCGAIEDTVVEDGVKIDNQVQIGHNCHIGAHTVICGCVGIAGSTRIGRHCVLAGKCGVGGDGPVELADGVVLSGGTNVMVSIDRPGVYSGSVLHETHPRWKRNAMRLRRLDELFRRVADLEKKVKDPTG
jgi:UDP-3-O-[3-hydroxymyristoyl] glucosamine N-acyltransferase